MNKILNLMTTKTTTMTKMKELKKMRRAIMRKNITTMRTIMTIRLFTFLK